MEYMKLLYFFDIKTIFAIETPLFPQRKEGMPVRFNISSYFLHLF